ncbi:MAG: nucleotidyltransferase [Candidatus Bathyarchaeia archaeon]
MSNEISRALERFTNFLEKYGIDYMIIGGYALSYYGRVRSTLDIDIALALRTEEDLNKFLSASVDAGYEASLTSFKNPVFMLLDKESGLEFEIWIRPDGIEWNDETLKRRRRKRFVDFDIWVISPEDLILNKLARPDRGVIDEQDVKSILLRLQGELDWEYLEEKAQKADVLSVLNAIKKV